MNGLDDLIDHLLDKGMDADDVASEVSEILDALIPLGVLGPAGVVLEVVDGPLIRALVSAALSARRDPDRWAARRAARLQRRDERRVRRAKGRPASDA